MTNGNYEQLVEQITDLVLSRLDNNYCPTFCSADVARIVDAGAERIGIVLGETATAHDWASLIDHTLLKPEASESDIKKLCDEAAQFGFASVCVNPAWVKKAAEFLKGTGVPVCTVIGFPLGATLPDVKAYETRRAIFNGAREVDMVINIGALKSGDDCAVEDDIRAVAEAADDEVGVRARLELRDAEAGHRLLQVDEVADLRALEVGSRGHRDGDGRVLQRLRPLGRGDDDLVAVIGRVFGRGGIVGRGGVLGISESGGGSGAQHGGAEQNVAQGHGVSLSNPAKRGLAAKGGDAPAGTRRSNRPARRVNAVRRDPKVFRAISD